jgi:nucleotide-binding universal stress UspA family protein
MSNATVILAAVDGSERSPEVVHAAAEIARQGMGRVHLYRSVTIPQEFPAAARMPPDKLPAILMEHARRDLGGTRRWPLGHCD